MHGYIVGNAEIVSPVLQAKLISLAKQKQLEQAQNLKDLDCENAAIFEGSAGAGKPAIHSGNNWVMLNTLQK